MQAVLWGFIGLGHCVFWEGSSEERALQLIAFSIPSRRRPLPASPALMFLVISLSWSPGRSVCLFEAQEQAVLEGGLGSGPESGGGRVGGGPEGWKQD